MTLPTRRSIITGLGAGAGLATAGLLSPSPAAAAESSHEFSSVIFDEQFSSGMDFSPSRWRDNRSEPESCTSYDWGVFTHDTHSVSNGVGHLLWRKRATPLKGFQNRFDKDETLRYVDQAFVTTQGLFSFVYGSLETRARFPQSVEGLFAGIWLRADDDDTEARSMSLRPMVAAAPPASRSRRCTSARREVQEVIWESHRAPISPSGTPMGWRRPQRAFFSSSTVSPTMRSRVQRTGRSSMSASVATPLTTSA